MFRHLCLLVALNPLIASEVLSSIRPIAYESCLISPDGVYLLLRSRRNDAMNQHVRRGSIAWGRLSSTSNEAAGVLPKVACNTHQSSADYASKACSGLIAPPDCILKSE